MYGLCMFLGTFVDCKINLSVFKPIKRAVWDIKTYASGAIQFGVPKKCLNVRVELFAGALLLNRR